VSNHQEKLLTPILAQDNWKLLGTGKCWLILINGLFFPPEIAPTNLRPDVGLWSGSARSVQLIELTVPWEDAVDETCERKKLRYAHLATEAEQRGCRVQVYPVEVGCRGFVAHSTTSSSEMSDSVAKSCFAQ